jgi:hypothetical protein
MATLDNPGDLNIITRVLLSERGGRRYRIREMARKGFILALLTLEV